MSDLEILRVKEIASLKGISLKELASKTELSYTYISEVARNVKFPRPDSLVAIAKALDIDIRELFISTKPSQSLDDQVISIIQDLQDVKGKLDLVLNNKTNTYHQKRIVLGDYLKQNDITETQLAEKVNDRALSLIEDLEANKKIDVQELRSKNLDKDIEDKLHYRLNDEFIAKKKALKSYYTDVKTISMMLHGDVTPSLSFLEFIADTLNTSIESFYE